MPQSSDIKKNKIKEHSIWWSRLPSSVLLLSVACFFLCFGYTEIQSPFFCFFKQEKPCYRYRTRTWSLSLFLMSTVPVSWEECWQYYKARWTGLVQTFFCSVLCGEFIGTEDLLHRLNFSSEVSNEQILVKKHWNGGTWTFPEVEAWAALYVRGASSHC